LLFIKDKCGSLQLPHFLLVGSKNDPTSNFLLCLKLHLGQIIVDLTSDHPFWFLKNGLTKSYPASKETAKYQVAVIGAGISGAIMADRLAREGYSVVVIDRRDVCLGSTSASTALLQYEIDVPLVKLAKKIGEEKARRAYILSHQSIDSLREIASDLPYDCGFASRTSIYMAFDRKAAAMLQDEVEARTAIGLNAKLLNAQEIAEKFSIQGTAAIVSTQAASVDPYLMAHGLLARAESNGAKIFDRTQILQFNQTENGVDLVTNRDTVIHAVHVVIATGYEAQSMLKKRIVKLKSTFACVSQPLDDLSPWNKDWMLWEAKDPYLYFRITDDNRLLVGGEDADFRDPGRRDRSLPKRIAKIHSKMKTLLPTLQWEVEFAWAGTFGETEDGLAYIGESSEYPNCYFALGFGGNGITFSTIASDLLCDLIAGRECPDLELFDFNR
jgi:glycine/D-amino acid oxidase-like deaminating enzyme